MSRILLLVLPILFPSWRFFAWIAPSPRIEWAIGAARDPEPLWRAWRPKPADFSLLERLWRLLWNPHGNETLFLTSCAERFLESADPQAIDTVRTLIAAEAPGDVAAMEPGAELTLHVRLLSVQRVADDRVRTEVWRATPQVHRREARP